jgi:hypothetical protein
VVCILYGKGSGIKTFGFLFFWVLLWWGEVCGVLSRIMEESSRRFVWNFFYIGGGNKDK